MSDPTTREDEDGMLAAEYVIGLLPTDERKAVEARLLTDSAFANLVDEWEAHFSGMNEEYGTVQPSTVVKAQIDARLFGTLRSQRRGRWVYGLAAACMAVVVMLGVVVLNLPPQTSLVAELAGEDSAYRFAVTVDDRDAAIDIALTSGALVADRTFELWLIPPSGVPRSLGVFGQAAQLPPMDDMLFQEGTVLAVSLEPIGGSPTGAPTGPVLAVGALSDA